MAILGVGVWGDRSGSLRARRPQKR